MDRWLPENISSFGTQIDGLFHFIYYLTNVTFLLVAGTLVAFLVLYRHRPGRRATYVEGNNTLEIVWTSATTVIVLALALYSRPVWAKIKEGHPTPDVEVRIMAKQFNWEITYPGPDGKFGTDDDQTMDNQLHVPVGKVVLVHLTSRDVIHSFFVPTMRLKQDALPGRTIPVWFQANKVGTFEIPCAELCGFGHSGMLGHMQVHDAASYTAWSNELWPPAPAAAAEAAPAA